MISPCLADRIKISKYRTIACFMLSMLAMYGVLWQLGLTGGGEYSPIFGDLRDNYIPAIRNLCRDIMNGESIYYSWNTAMGMNTSLYNAFYAYNPFHILYLIFYNGDDNLTTIAIILIKTGLSGACFESYIRKSHGIEGIWGIVFAIFYSMSSFQVVYNTTNIIWLDATFVLPLAFRYIDVLCERGESLILSLVYTYIFMTQFYMGYTIGLITLLYLGLKLILYRNDISILPCFIRYFVSVILAVGMSAWVWVPTVLFLINNNPNDATQFQSMKTSFLGTYEALFCRELSGINAASPNIYCGIPTVAASILFFISHKITVKQKCLYGIMLLFLYSSCFVLPLYELWHGFNNPDGWTYRFAYIICFVLCVMSANALDKIDHKTSKLYVIIATILIFLYCAIKFKTPYSGYMTNVSYNVTFTVIWICLVEAYLYCEEKHSKWKCILRIIVISITLSELLVSYRNQPILESDTRKAENSLWNLTQRETVAELSRDKEFYRVNYLNDLGICSGTYYGYNSMAHFSSAENPDVRMTLGKLGLAESARATYNFGLTPLTEMLFDVKYDVVGAKYRVGMQLEDTYSAIQQNDNILSLGYMVYGNTDDYSLDSNNAFENNNRLLSLMTGERIEAFSNITDDQVEITEHGISLTKTDGRYMVEMIAPGERTGDENLTFTVDSKNEIYAYVYNKTPLILDRGFILEGGYENSIQYIGKLSMSYIKHLERENGEAILRIVPYENAWRQTFDDIYFACYNDDQVQKAYDLLKDNQFMVDEYKDGYVKGHVTATKSKSVLFTTIPYDKGWTAKVNGNPIETKSVLNGSFLAVVLPNEGDYEVEMSFCAQGAWIGLIVSLISCLIIVLGNVCKMKRLNYGIFECIF